MITALSGPLTGALVGALFLLALAPRAHRHAIRTVQVWCVRHELARHDFNPPPAPQTPVTPPAGDGSPTPGSGTPDPDPGVGSQDIAPRLG